MGRESGYYWVQALTDVWEIKLYVAYRGKWILTSDKTGVDSFFKKINENRILNPDENPKRT